MTPPGKVESFVAAVFDRHPGGRPGRPFLLALLAGLGLHAGTVLWAVASAPSLENWSADLAMRVHAELTREEVIELPKPPPEKPPERPPPPPLPKEPVVRTRPAPSPAQAGRIIAAQPAGPVDLPGTTFITGSAASYAGGTTSSTGKSTVAVSGPVVGTGPANRTRDLSSPVTLEDTDWNCPWPREADAQQIDEQAVVLKVVVRVNGTVESVRTLSDPGHGFAAAARLCALQTRMSPARDREGRAERAESPPIRVHFSR